MGSRDYYRQVWTGIFVIVTIIAVFVGMHMSKFDEDVVAKDAYEEGYEEGLEDYPDEECDYRYLKNTKMAFSPDDDVIQTSHAKFYEIVALILTVLFIIYNFRRHDRCVSLLFAPMIMSLILISVFFIICSFGRSRNMLGEVYTAYFFLAWSIVTWMISFCGDIYEVIQEDAINSYRKEIDSLEEKLKEKGKSI